MLGTDWWISCDNRDRNQTGSCLGATGIHQAQCDAENSAKRSGWVKVNGRHFCPACRKLRGLEKQWTGEAAEPAEVAG